MINAVLIFHIIITASLIGIVLIQKSEGGALGMGGGGGGGFMTTRGTANLLTRVTGVLAVLFFITTLSLAFLAKGAARPRSILDETTPSEIPMPSPGSVPASSTTGPQTPKDDKSPLEEPVKTSDKKL